METFLKNLWSVIQNWFERLPPGQGVVIIIALVSLFVMILTYKATRSKRKRRFPFGVDCLENLIEKLFPGKKLEEYIQRRQLMTDLGQGMIARYQLILIHGLSGVGKTREAVELIRRQNTLLGQSIQRKNIYFARGGEVAIPTGLVRDIPISNTIFFIDDLRTDLSIEDVAAEGRKKIEPVSERLKAAIDFFKEKCDSRMIVVTMLTQEYLKLKEEPLSSELTENSLVIELKIMSPIEKTSYVEKLADAFQLAINESIKRGFVEASDESLSRLYVYFEHLQSQGKKLVETEDLEEFKKIPKMFWEQEYNSLALEEQLIFDSLTKLYQFSIPSFSYAVVELCIFSDKIKKISKPFAKWRFIKTLRNLDGKWFRIEENKVYCPDSRLFLKTAEDPHLKKDLQFISEFIEKLTRKRKYEKDFYYLLMPLTRALHNYEEYEWSVKLNDRMLGLPLKALPTNSKKAKSAILFHKGHSLYCIGRKNWNLVESCYKDSIRLYDQNLFAKHALATLYREQANLPEALKYLDEIIKANKRDVLAYKTKLEILTEAGIDLNEAKKTYCDIRRLLRGGFIPVKVALSAEFACVRFSVKIGEFLQEAGEIEKAEKRFNKAIKQYEILISKIPPEENEVEAVVRNAYSCFFYDIFNKPDIAIFQLEKAREAWPKHTHTLHKLASIYLDQAEIQVMERNDYIQRAKDLLNEVLNIDPDHYPTRLLITKLEVESIDWYSIDELEFWKEVSEIYGKYKYAIEPESTNYPSLHNAIAHHVTGCFLWYIEFVAHKKNFLGNKPSSIPLADLEFIESINIEKCFRETPPRYIQDHLILAYWTTGAYCMTVSDFPRGRSFLKEAIDLSKKAGSDFRFHSQNSYAESFVGKSLLSMREKDAAKKYLKSAVRRFDKNWRAWWWLGRIHEIDREFSNARECFEKSSEGQLSPSLYGQLRSIVQDWMNDGKITPDFNRKIKYSQRSYSLDPNGELNPKNISDYGFDLYQKGKNTGDQDSLQKAKDLLFLAGQKYTEAGLKEEAAFPLWYVGECLEIMNGQINQDVLKYYIESAILADNPGNYAELNRKVHDYGNYEKAIECFIYVIDYYPDKESLYFTMISTCCDPIWKKPHQTLNANVVQKIENCAKRHSQYQAATQMIGIVLQRNRENERALPYLEKVRTTEDTFTLRALMECYYRFGKKEKANEICQQLYLLLDDDEKRKLQDRASKLGLKCF